MNNNEHCNRVMKNIGHLQQMVDEINSDLLMEFSSDLQKWSTIYVTSYTAKDSSIDAAKHNLVK